LMLSFRDSASASASRISCSRVCNSSMVRMSSLVDHDVCPFVPGFGAGCPFPVMGSVYRKELPDAKVDFGEKMGRNGGWIKLKWRGYGMKYRRGWLEEGLG